MKAITVARVSTEEQREAGNSLPAQEARLNNYCQKKTLTIIKGFSFDESAYKTKRDEFDKLLEEVKAISTKEKIAVCFDKVDRLSRNVFDKRVAELYEMAIADRIELHFVSDGQVINNQMSAVEKFQFGMSLGLAKYYSDAISDNVKRVFEQKRKNGEWTGKAPLGYLNVVGPDGRNTIIVDQQRSHTIIKMFEMYASGNFSLETIRREVTELGLKSRDGYNLSKSQVEKMLREPFYYGEALSKKYNLKYLHKYPRLITKEVFDRCQEIRAGKRKKLIKLNSKPFIFKGLLTCFKCGCVISPEIKKGKFIYYSCTNSKGICKRVYVPEKDLLKPIYGVLERLEGISTDTQTQLVEELRKANEAEVIYHKAQIERIRNEYDEAQKKIEKLLDFLLDERITQEEYDKKLVALKDGQQILSIELEQYTQADHNYKTTVASVFSVAKRAKSIFDSSEIDEKRAFLNYLIQNPTVNGKKLCFTIASPFNLILELTEFSAWLRE